MSIENRTDLSPASGDNAHITQKKILQRLNASLPAGDHDAIIQDGDPALNVRVLNHAILDYSRGLHANQGAVHKFGRNDIVPNGSFADIWSYGPTQPAYPWPGAAETVRIKAGGSASDDVAGIGARSITIHGLDENWHETTEVVVTAGASASAPTVTTFIRVYRVRVTTVGTLNISNVGTILIENTGALDVLAEVRPGAGSTEMTHFTIPEGRTGFVSRVDAQVVAGTNKSADVSFFTRTNLGTGLSVPFGPNVVVQQWTGLDDRATAEYTAFRGFPGMTDIWFRAQGNSATTSVVVTYDIFLL
jgi:hypothetical protein